jgi:hypothetical protein
MPIFFSLLLFLCACKRSHDQKIRGEYLFRNHNEYFFQLASPQKRDAPTYPWELNQIAGVPHITKDFFRCRGSRQNPVKIQQKEGSAARTLRDCTGGHGLPLKGGREFIYPALIDLLNYLQEKTGKKVIITTGYRCPEHNTYCDPSPKNWNSKHQIGAEVDFYVESFETQPEQILAFLQQYYKEKPPFANDPTFTRFTRYEKSGLNVATPPWMNKEILVKLYLPEEGRDQDNQHTYPYLGIQLRWDRNSLQPITFDSRQAQNYLRH